jgi:hypothetical protein
MLISRTRLKGAGGSELLSWATATPSEQAAARASRASVFLIVDLKDWIGFDEGGVDLLRS